VRKGEKVMSEIERIREKLIWKGVLAPSYVQDVCILLAEIDSLRATNENLLVKLERSNDAWIKERAENAELKGKE